MTIDRKAFFDRARAGILGPRLEQGEVDGCTALLDAMEAVDWSRDMMAAALGQVYHETDGTMMPIKERGSDSYFERRYGPEHAPKLAKDLGNLYPGDGARFCGRGFIQETGRRNYTRASKFLGRDCIASPDILLEPVASARSMVNQLTIGGYTGRKLSAYAGATGFDFFNARSCVNGDKHLKKKIGKDRVKIGDLVARYGAQFRAALG